MGGWGWGWKSQPTNQMEVRIKTSKKYHDKVLLCVISKVLKIWPNEMVDQSDRELITNLVLLYLKTILLRKACSKLITNCSIEKIRNYTGWIDNFFFGIVLLFSSILNLFIILIKKIKLIMIIHKKKKNHFLSGLIESGF